MSSGSDLSAGDESDLISDSSSESENKTPSAEPEPKTSADDDPETLRFRKELEFVLSLANPRYLYFLAQKNYFGDPFFINYLKYLLYWCDPPYARFIRYPQALQFLKFLQDPDFRLYVSNGSNITAIERDQYHYWQNYQRNRLDITLPEPEVKTPDAYPE